MQRLIVFHNGKRVDVQVVSYKQYRLVVPTGEQKPRK